MKGQKNKILTRRESRDSSRPDGLLFFARRTFFITIADPHRTNCQATQVDTQTEECQRVQFCQRRKNSIYK